MVTLGVAVLTGFGLYLDALVVLVFLVLPGDPRINEYGYPQGSVAPHEPNRPRTRTPSCWPVSTRGGARRCWGRAPVNPCASGWLLSCRWGAHSCVRRPSSRRRPRRPPVPVRSLGRWARRWWPPCPGRLDHGVLLAAGPAVPRRRRVRGDADGPRRAGARGAGSPAEAARLYRENAWVPRSPRPLRACTRISRRS